MITAKDVMIPWVVTTTRQTPVYKAIDLMLEHKISGLPVVDDDRVLVGFISERDILQVYNTKIQLRDMTVKDLMATPAISFDKDDTLDDIWACLLRNNFRRVPVTSSGRIVGIVSGPDINRNMLQKIKRTRLVEVN
jgi:CBS domain-containing protein